MQDYGITLLTKTQDDKEAVKDIIAKVGGEVLDEKSLGQKILAYPIKKERVANFTLLHCQLEKEAVPSLNREFVLSGHVLRHMITTAKARVLAKAAPDLAEAPSSAGVLGKQARTTRGVSLESEIEPAREKEKAAPKTKAELKVEAKAAKERQKRIEEELEKILREE